MCGIIGIASTESFTSKELLSRLKKLEYRGYDSFGYWNGKTLDRRTGKIIVADDGERTNAAISHTRWATHGGVTQNNAHPHRFGSVTIVHNGIIENYKELKAKINEVFSSETDSELIAHFVNKKLKSHTIKEILQDLIEEIEGTFATLIMIDGDDNIYAAKRDSPLALGICEERLILASDIYAFSDTTNKAIFFDNDEFAIITPKEYSFYDKTGNSLQKQPQTFEWESIEKDKQDFAHFMLKEIHESPIVSARLLTSLKTIQKDKLHDLINLMKQSKKIVFTACGTAYHAALLGASFLHQQGLNAQAIISSEFENFITVDKDTLVIAVSQSGETMDVIESLKYSLANGATIASIVNVPYSSIERMSSLSLQILAGQEVAVASTKAFVNQCTMIMAIAEEFGYPGKITHLPNKLKELLLQEDLMKKISFDLHRQNDLYILGRKWGYPIAREIALKIKEVSYVHAEGMMGGELKHGTIALIENGTPVISLIYDGDHKMRASTQEVAARGAKTIVIGTQADDDIVLPTKNEAEFSILAGVVGQLLAYYIALERGLPIDKPRNLAKSVTVL